MTVKKTMGIVLAVLLASPVLVACDEDGTENDSGTDADAGDATDTGADTAADTAEEEPGVTCMLPEIDCGGECVNPNKHPDHCGGCDNACAASEVCLGGTCEADCGDLTDCDRACVDITIDEDHCGECGNECDAGLVCGYMVCTSDVCAPGEVYCYGNCTSLEGDPFNCGECGNACDPDLENCMEGECVPAI